MLTISDWVDGELLSSVRAKIRAMFTTLNQEGHNIQDTAPSSPVAGQVWTNVTQGIVYQRNTTNTAWIPVRRVNGQNVAEISASTTIPNTGFGTMYVMVSSTVTTAIQLPSPGTVANGWYVDFNNSSANEVVVAAPNPYTVDNTTLARIPPGAGARFVKYGSEYYTLGRPKFPTVVNGVLGSGYTGAANATADGKATNSYIDLPPGKWKVELTLLMTGTIAASSFTWMRIFLGTGSTSTANADAVGSNMIGQCRVYPAPYAIAHGTVVVNNTSGNTKRYWWVLGAADPWDSATNTFTTVLGSSWVENNIRAYRLSE